MQVKSMKKIAATVSCATGGIVCIDGMGAEIDFLSRSLRVCYRAMCFFFSYWNISRNQTQAESF